MDDVGELVQQIVIAYGAVATVFFVWWCRSANRERPGRDKIDIVGEALPFSVCWLILVVVLLVVRFGWLLRYTVIYGCLYRFLNWVLFPCPRKS